MRPGKSLVEARNPNYKGTRPANPDKIVWNMNTDQDQSLLQVKSGQVDVDASRPPADVVRPARRSSTASTRAGSSSAARSCVLYWALNTHAGAVQQHQAARKAVNWALDRPAMVRLFGQVLRGKRSDQILVPGVPGYKPYNLYAFRGANPAKAKARRSEHSAGKTAAIFHSTNSTADNIVRRSPQFNLTKIGMKTKDKPVPGSGLLQGARHQGRGLRHAPAPAGARTTSTRSTTSTSTSTAARSRTRTTSTSRTSTARR